MRPRKATLESRSAQLAEALVLAVAGAWVTLLVRQEEQQIEEHGGVAHTQLEAEKPLLQAATMSHTLLALHALGFAAVVWSSFKPHTLPNSLRACCRQERDAGLVIGCVLPPLVLLSRLLAEIYCDGNFSSFTFFYAWTSISVGVSTLFKVSVFKSTTSIGANLLVDVLLLPAVFGLLTPVEAEWRFLLATGGRCMVSGVVAMGLRLLPRSFTVGEALLVAQGVGLCAYDLVLSTLSQLNELDVIDLSPHVLHPWLIFSMERTDHVLALQIGTLGSLLVCVALAPVFRLHGSPLPNTVAPPPPVQASVAFVVTAVVVVGLVVYPLSCFLLGTWNPFVWLLRFLTKVQDESTAWLGPFPSLPPRIMLMGYWMTCLVLLVPAFTFIVGRLELRQIVARKLFHLLVVVMLGPAFFVDSAMLSLSYGVALAVFFLVECVRALALPPFGATIAAFMRSFIDHREAGRVILTHSYLLLGCALPLWLAPSNPSPLVANAGVLALGVGDAMGAVVGSSIGKHKLFGSKTIEGSLAVFVSMLVVSMVFHDYHTRSFFDGGHQQMLLLTLAVLMTSVLEAATAQIDNLVLPLFFYTTCNLVACYGH